MCKENIRIMEVFDELFPMNRCISGKGLRDSLDVISRYVPLILTEYPSGEKCSDWEVPLEWNINQAYVANHNGQRLIDFERCNLHVLAYCAPFEGWVTREELLEHLYFLEEMPDAIPYITSVYEKRWGFCIPYDQLKDFNDPTYYVHIDASFSDGSLTVGESLLGGKSEKEIAFFVHTGHPSMANDQLSGILTLILIYEQLAQLKEEHFFTYRFIFCPETIGTAIYLKHHIKHFKRNLYAGYTVTFIGDPSPVKYRQTLQQNMPGDLAAINAMGGKHIYDFTPFGSDERHFNSPGIDLPFGAFIRAGAYQYPQYHTSLDDRSVINEERLREAASMIVRTVKNLEADRRISTKYYGFEPKLDKLHLFPTLGKKYGHKLQAHQILAIWRLSSKYKTLLEISQILGLCAFELSEAMEIAERIGLITTERGIV